MKNSSSVIALLLISFQICFGKGLFGTNIDPSKVSVSGLSSGAFFAVQTHIAFSSDIMGAGIFAGGPYYCAQNGLTDAFLRCMYAEENIDVPKLVKYVKTFASQGIIDDPRNLTNDRVYLYSGESDSIVNPAVMKQVNVFYQNFISQANIQTQFTINSEHTLPTDKFGNSCGYLGAPYISNCNYDGAGYALQGIYGKLNPRTTQNPGSILSFSQNDYVPSGYEAGDLSMGPNAFAYVPLSCNSTNSNIKCALHFAFHGCQQTIEDINSDFYIKGGYNEWAESNKIVIIYLQIIKSIIDPLNPEGCYDWWGYTDSNYANKNGLQMQTFKNILDRFLS